jgi:hypothetical protein
MYELIDDGSGMSGWTRHTRLGTGCIWDSRFSVMTNKLITKYSPIANAVNLPSFLQPFGVTTLSSPSSVAVLYRANNSKSVLIQHHIQQSK